MSKVAVPLNWWPDGSQTLLLQAACSPDSRAQAAWQTWRALQLRPGLIDEGSWRLLPLVFTRVVTWPDGDPPVWLRDLYRRTWFENQQLARQAAGLLTQLGRHGTKTLVLKGLAMLPMYYRQWGVRPMADFDILVSPTHVAQTIVVLEQAGWQLAQPGERVADLMTVKQATEFANAAGQRVDLHWYALWNNCYPGADDPFWEAAVPLQINQASTLALNPTDQLLHTCVHGAGLNPVPPVRWAADAMQILTISDRVDWKRLVRLAAQLQLSLPLAEALAYLSSALEAPVPAQVLSELAALPTTEHERQLQRHRGHVRGLLGELPLLWHHYVMQTERRQARPKLIGYLRYLRHYYHLRSVPQAAAFVTQKATRRLRAVRGRRAP